MLQRLWVVWTVVSNHSMWLGGKNWWRLFPVDFNSFGLWTQKQTRSTSLLQNIQRLVLINTRSQKGWLLCKIVPEDDVDVLQKAMATVFWDYYHITQWKINLRRVYIVNGTIFWFRFLWCGAFFSQGELKKPQLLMKEQPPAVVFNPKGKRRAFLFLLNLLD